MKKLIVIALAVVMALSLVLVLAACGGETYEGECSYGVKYNPNGDPSMYGVKVKVTVNNGVITKVELVDYDAWTRTTKRDPDWAAGKPGEAGFMLGYEKTEAAYPDFLTKFEGKTVEEVKAIKITMISGTDNTAEASYTVTVADKANWAIAGATQSAARIIAAVQNALSKIPA
ncbi:MAG: hypothetical protein J1F68_01475 [Clostridiales bacterium]|nr:hypothetical protein [Clostridiales bacterium]